MIIKPFYNQIFALILVCILIPVQQTIWAQEVLQESWHSKQNGYDYGAVTSAAFDKKGRAYLATSSGLIVYDGFKFTPLKLHEKHKISRTVEKVYRDNNNRIWFTCYPKGWGYYDPETGLSRDFSDDNKFDLHYIYAVYQSKDGNIWLGSHFENEPRKTGLFLFDLITLELKQFMFEPRETFHLRQTADKVNAITEDKNGNLWLSTWSGLVHFNPKNKTHSLYFRDGAPFNLCTTLYLHNDTTLFVGVWGRGLVEFNVKTKHWTYTLPQIRKELIGTHNVVSAITQFKKNMLLIGTLDAGLCVYDITAKKFRSPYDINGDISTNLKEGVKCIHQDNRGNFLAGTMDKGFYIIPNTCTQTTYLFIPQQKDLLHKITQVYEVPNSDLLMCLSVYGKYAFILNSISRESFNICADEKEKNIDYNFAYPLTSTTFYVNTSVGGYIYDVSKNLFTKLDNHYYPLNTSYLTKSHSTDCNFLWVLLNDTLYGYDNSLSLQKKYTLHSTLSPNFQGTFNFEVIHDTEFYIQNYSGELLFINLQNQYFTTTKSELLYGFKRIVRVNDTLLVKVGFAGLDYIQTKNGRVNVVPFPNTFTKAVTRFNNTVTVNPNQFIIVSETGYLTYDRSSHQVKEYDFPDEELHYSISYLANRNRLCFSNPGKIILQPHIENLHTDSLHLAAFEANGENYSEIITYIPDKIVLPTHINHISFEILPFDLMRPKLIYSFYLVKEGDTIQTDQSNSKAVYTNLRHGSYVFSAVAKNPFTHQKYFLKHYMLEISTPWYLTSFFLSISGLLLIASLYLLYLRRIATIKKQANLEQKIVEANLSALRSQMNPHFIFNSLNSINKFILRHHPDDASDYLTTFAKLIRLILENSRLQLINIEKELEALRLYVDLEQLRLAKPIKLNVYIESIENVLIQPLLLQPFIENSIWHGFADETIREGQIFITIKQLNNRVTIIIADNGIGKTDSSKPSASLNRDSLGIELTSRRLTMVDKSAKVEYNNNPNSNGFTVILEYANS